MNQTKFSKDASPLIDAAISKLRPGLFSHPVWIRFGSKEKPVPPKTIKALSIEAEKLKQHNPGDACQVMLAYAVFQHYSGQTDKALKTIHDVLRLAHHEKMEDEILWALWGACAICFQIKMFSQAAEHLTSLKHLLSERDDWVLAGFVDVVRQTLTQEAKTYDTLPAEYKNNKSMGSVLQFTFDWLNQWGFSAQIQQSNSNSSQDRHQDRQKSLPSLSLRSLRLLFRGELIVNWLDDNLRQGSRSTFWGYILSLFHVEVTSHGRGNEAEIIDSETVPFDTFEPGSPEELTGADNKEPVFIEEPVVEAPLSISVQMLGNFNLMIQETALDLPSSRSLSLLKYLLLHHAQYTPREVLLEIFWPDLSLERGRNNLNVALNGIRTAMRTLTDSPVILYKEGTYGIAPTIQFWADVEEFERLVGSGRRLDEQNRLPSAVSEYEAAISLYKGDFLEENPYENWTVLPRERLRLAYLTTLDRLSHIYFDQENYAICITLAQLILSRDRCREDAHCMLMRCYSRQGQDHLALRQYQACVDALRLELDVTPAPETTKLYEEIRQHNRV